LLRPGERDIAQRISQIAQESRTTTSNKYRVDRKVAQQQKGFETQLANSKSKLKRLLLACRG